MHGILERITRLRDEVQVHTHQTKIIMDVGVVGLEISRVGQVTQRALLILLFARDPCQLQ